MREIDHERRDVIRRAMQKGEVPQRRGAARVVRRLPVDGIDGRLTGEYVGRNRWNGEVTAVTDGRRDGRLVRECALCADCVNGTVMAA